MNGPGRLSQIPTQGLPRSPSLLAIIVSIWRKVTSWKTVALLAYNYSQIVSSEVTESAVKLACNYSRRLDHRLSCFSYRLLHEPNRQCLGTMPRWKFLLIAQNRSEQHECGIEHVMRPRRTYSTRRSTRTGRSCTMARTPTRLIVDGSRDRAKRLMSLNGPEEKWSGTSDMSASGTFHNHYPRQAVSPGGSCSASEPGRRHGRGRLAAGAWPRTI